jgi:hypothetical protein
MADLEAVLQDITYLVAMEKSRTQPAQRSKKIILPDPRYSYFLFINFSKFFNLILKVFENVYFNFISNFFLVSKASWKNTWLYSVSNLFIFK